MRFQPDSNDDEWTQLALVVEGQIGEVVFGPTIFQPLALCHLTHKRLAGVSGQHFDCAKNDNRNHPEGDESVTEVPAYESEQIISLITVMEEVFSGFCYRAQLKKR